MKECPLCPPHKNDITNLWTLGIFADKGSWNCFRCGNHGNWSSLIKIFNLYGNQQSNALDENYYDLYNLFNNGRDNNYDGFDVSNENEESEIEEICRNDWISENEVNHQNELLLREKPLLNRLIKQRNLSLKCFKDYKCGLQYKYFANLKQKQQCITFPMYQYKNDEFIATKYKTRCVSNGVKQFGQYPIQNESGLFGFDKNNKNCIITEGEYDSMAIYYGTNYKMKPLSLPNGANNISNKLIKQLSQVYDNFIIFLDWDQVGQKNANLLKNKLNENDIKNVEIIRKEDNMGYINNEHIKDANDIMIMFGNNGHEIMDKMISRYV